MKFKEQKWLPGITGLVHENGKLRRNLIGKNRRESLKLQINDEPRRQERENEKRKTGREILERETETEKGQGFRPKQKDERPFSLYLSLSLSVRKSEPMPGISGPSFSYICILNLFSSNFLFSLFYLFINSDSNFFEKKNCCWFFP